MRPFLSSLLALTLGGPAFAQGTDEPPPAPTPAPTTEPQGERVVLPAKRLYVRAMLEIELSKDAAFDPVSLAPDLFYGVSADFTVGLTHSSSASTGIIGGTGSSLCLGDACDSVYRNVGLDGR